jgi:aldose 1-epimerase
MTPEWFGILEEGRTVDAYTMSNTRGSSIRLLTYGATIQSIVVPDRHGRNADVVLGYASLKDYLSGRDYSGATIGRVANRIARASFILDRAAHQLSVNDGANSLHGGHRGFDKVLWQAAEENGDPTRVALRYISNDGEEGYPGRLTVTAIFGLNESNEISIDYSAVCDQPTIVNISNHAYFNLAGEGSRRGVMDHLLRIFADEFTPVDEALIPTGEIKSVIDTPFDFREAKAIGRGLGTGRDRQIVYGGGYDHNFVVSRTVTEDLRLVARVEDPISGRVMEVLSNQPGLHFYSGGYFDETVNGKSGRAYRRGDGFALEPQLLPDTPNRPTFGSARLAPGEIYRHRMVFRFSAATGS